MKIQQKACKYVGWCTLACLDQDTDLTWDRDDEIQQKACKYVGWCTLACLDQDTDLTWDRDDGKLPGQAVNP